MRAFGEDFTTIAPDVRNVSASIVDLLAAIKTAHIMSGCKVVEVELVLDYHSFEFLKQQIVSAKLGDFRFWGDKKIKVSGVTIKRGKLGAKT